MLAMSSYAWPFWLLLCYWCCVALTGGRIVISIDSSSSEGDVPPNNRVSYCSDHMKNQDETDIDCGGIKCPKCENMKSCMADCDCISDICKNNTCIPPVSCEDKIQNQDESDIDCGGIKCPKCNDTKTCKTHCDCISDVCTNNSCAPPASCEDKIQNQDESDVDCGGHICPKCNDTQSCNQSSDCMSGVCTNNDVCSFSCVPECKNNGTCIAENNCSCTSGFSGPTCEVQSVGLCSVNDTLSAYPILLITFGHGSSLYSNATPADFNASTTYTQDFVTVVQDGTFGFVNQVPDNKGAWQTGATDHTGDEGGYMMLVNADFDPGQFYNGTVNNLCVGQRYEFSVYLANICKPSNKIKPNVRFQVRATVGNQLLAQLDSGEVPEYNTLTWQKYGLSFIPPSSTVVLLMISNAAGGNGNDLVIDDIALRVCAQAASGFCPPN